MKFTYLKKKNFTRKGRFVLQQLRNKNKNL